MLFITYVLVFIVRKGECTSMSQRNGQLFDEKVVNK